MSEIRIYFEGDKKLQPGFHKFLGEVYSKANRSVSLQLIRVEALPYKTFKLRYENTESDRCAAEGQRRAGFGKAM